MPNAIIAAGMVISFGNVLQHHDHRNTVEDKIVVVWNTRGRRGGRRGGTQRWSRRTTASWSRSGHVRTRCTCAGICHRNAGTAAVPGPNPSGAGSGN